jgi:hypothetical protein
MSAGGAHLGRTRSALSGAGGWKAHVPKSAGVWGGYIYSDNGLLSCFGAKTGKPVYRERLGSRGGYTALPVAADGKIHCTSEQGEVSVVRAGPKFEVLALNALGDPSLATPAISDGMTFLRTGHDRVGIGRTDAGECAVHEAIRFVPFQKPKGAGAAATPGSAQRGGQPP